MDTFILIFEIIGTVAFAISGAVKGIKRGMDLFGVAILGLVTGVGGGVIRDTVLGNTPATAFKSPLFAIIALSCAVLTFIIIGLVGKRVTTEIKNYERNILFLADTIGLAVFTMTGARIAEESSAKNITATIFIGVITAVGGGILRDVFCTEVPDVFKKHVYAVASAAGALIFLIVGRFLPEWIAVVCGFFTIVLLRFLAAHYRWNLPKVNPDNL
ncbi:MAG: trimeric intracellular cation channel family protein [Clostridia bacterium]|nr:trimeric intracellular cation channel family protein [Clostridia bacterium]